MRVRTFRLRDGQIKLRLVHRDLRGGEFRSGNGSGVQTLLQLFYNFRLRGELRLQQRGAVAAHLQIQQAVTDMAANLPGRRDKTPARGLGHLDRKSTRLKS